MTSALEGGGGGAKMAIDDIMIQETGTIKKRTIIDNRPTSISKHSVPAEL